MAMREQGAIASAGPWAGVESGSGVWAEEIWKEG